MNDREPDDTEPDGSWVEIRGDVPDETPPCPDCDSPGEQLNVEIACTTESCDVGDYLSDGTVLWRA